MKTIIISLIFLTVFISCEKVLLNEEYQNTAYDNYNAFWQEFDRSYGAMQPKKMNWDSLKTVYGNSINLDTTNKQLFEALCGLLHEINDGHADLYAPGFGYYRSWNRRDKSYYLDYNTQDMKKVSNHQKVVRREYLGNQYESTSVDGWTFFYGNIDAQNKKIGYLCIPTFNIINFPDDFIQSAVDAFQSSGAVIVDLRFNGGGTTEAFVKTLNRFASEPKVFLNSKYRNGNGHGDFSRMFEHQIHPHENCLKPKPIAILINSYTASSSEHFILGMKTQKDVITVGDTTCGAFSSVNERLLPNGWKFRLGGQVVFSPEGKLLVDDKSNYVEGVGLSPDFYVTDHWQPLNNDGIDLPLDKAIEELLK